MPKADNPVQVDNPAPQSGARRKRRHITETERREIAAEQAWRCASCEQMLSAAFQVDHKKPLWDDGPDERSNLQCLCGSCHSLKTSVESRQRAKQKADMIRVAAREAQAAWETDVRERHATSQRVVHVADTGVSVCLECQESYYTLFGHRTCPAIARRVSREIVCSGRRERSPQPQSPTERETVETLRRNPFIRFVSTPRVAHPSGIGTGAARQSEAAVAGPPPPTATSPAPPSAPSS